MQPKLTWHDVDSSNVLQIAHDDETMTLAVKFKGGALYSYEGVVHQVFTSLENSPSVGRYLNEAIKGSYPYLKHEDDKSLLSYIKARREAS